MKQMLMVAAAFLVSASAYTMPPRSPRQMDRPLIKKISLKIDCRKAFEDAKKRRQAKKK